eukprot:4855987-Amphidinium_carterae.1
MSYQKAVPLEVFLGRYIPPEQLTVQAAQSTIEAILTERAISTSPVPWTSDISQAMSCQCSFALGGRDFVTSRGIVDTVPWGIFPPCALHEQSLLPESFGCFVGAHLKLKIVRFAAECDRAHMEKLWLMQTTSLATMLEEQQP